MNVSPGRSDSSMRIGASTCAAPRDRRGRARRRPARRGRVLRGDVERLAASQRRRVARRLDARVVRVEPAAGREADREVVVEPVDRRVVLDGHERGTRSPAPGPPTAASGGTARRGGSRRSTATGCRPALRAGRSSSRRASATGSAELVPGVLGPGPAPVAAHPARELGDDRTGRRARRRAAPSPCARAGRAVPSS